MADDLPIKITLDPSQAAAGARKVADEVAKTEAAAKAAEKAHAAFEKELAKVNAEMQELAANAKTAGNAVANQRAQSQQAANTIGLSSQSLNAARANAGLTGAANSMVGNFTGGLGAAGAIAGVGMAIDKGLEDLDRYDHKLQDATNALIRFYGTHEQAAGAVGKFQQLAYATNSALGDTVEAFDAVEGATQTLNLTRQQQIDITRNLTQTLIADGKSIKDLTPIMERLEFAISRGNVTSLELSRIMRQQPEIAERWRKEFGVTTKQLLTMADNGELAAQGLDRLLTTFAKGDAVSEKFAERQLTLNDLQAAGGDGVISLNRVMIEHTEAMEAAKDTTLSWAEATLRLTNDLQKLHDQTERRAEGLKAGIAGEVVRKAFRETTLAVGMATAELEKHNDLMNFIGDDGAKKYHERIDRLNKELKAGTITQLDYDLGLDKLNKKHDEGAKAVKKHTDEYKRLAEQIFALARAPRPNSQHTEGERAKQELQDDVDQQTFFEKMASDQARDEIDPDLVGPPKSTGINTEGIKKDREQVLAYQAAVDDLTKNSFAALEAAAQSVGDALVDAFMDGEFQAEKFFDSLARMMLKSAVSNLIGFGFQNLGISMGMGGGATGFDYMANGQRLQLPGFATGGDMLVGGAGSTDSRIAAFRVTPGESIHVRTPEQRREASQGGGGGVKIVNQTQDRRALLQGFDGDGEFDRVVLNVLQRNQGAVRSLG